MSAYSASPSFASTTSGTPFAELKVLTQGLDRLEDKRFQRQRFELSDQKIDYLSMLALEAKVERALASRMTDQDAEMRVNPSILSRPIDEKAEIRERQAAAA